MAIEPMARVVHELRRAASVPTGPEPSDADLLQAFLARRDETAFAMLLRRHGPLVLGVCRRLLGNEEDAADAFQAVFLILAQRARSIRSPDALGAWLYGVAYRASLKARGKRNRRQAREVSVPDVPEREVEMPLPPDDLLAILDEELNLLPEKYRAAVVLCELQGQPRSVAARALKIPEGTLSSRLATARRLLRDRLLRRGIAPSVGALVIGLASGAARAGVPAQLLASTLKTATAVAGGGAAAGVVSARVLAIKDGTLKAMFLSKLKIGILLLAAVGLAATGTGLIAHRVVAAVQQPSRTDVAQPEKPKQPELADAEMHVIGIYGPKNGFAQGGDVDVEVRPTAKPVVLALASYYSVLWKVKLAPAAQVKAVIIGGYFEQESEGIPAGIPIAYRTYFPDDGSRRGQGWFYAHEWNTPRWREMARRLNEMTGLPVASFQGKEQGDSFIIDGTQGRGLGQNGLKSRAPARKRLIPEELRAASANAELHVVGISSPDRQNQGKPVDVEVRPTAKPVVLVLTSDAPAVWNVKAADGARIKVILVGSPWPQEVEGVSADVPVQYYCPDPSFFFDRKGSQRNQPSFHASQWNTFEYRRMVEKLNDLTGLLVATFQGKREGTAFVVDGVRGGNFAQKERKPRPRPPKEPTPQELRAAAAGAELHVVSTYGAAAGNGAPVDVEVRPTAEPMVLALASYSSVLWNVKLAPGARVKAVVIGGYFEQEFEGIPAGIPIVYRAYYPFRKQGYFYGHEWKTRDCQGMVEHLNDLTGLLVATFQGQYSGTSFVVDGERGRNSAQKERKVKKTPKTEENPLADVADIPSQELRAGGDADKRYFLIGPKQNAQPAGGGYGLLVILPGGDGSADFHPFVKRIYKYALSDRYLAAQPVAVQWTPDNPNEEIVWPTKTNPVAKMKFTTEEFVEAVIRDVAKKHRIDRTRIFTLSWSSSGPAAYAASLRKECGVTGSFIAMSVFVPESLPPLQGAKDHAYYLYHSPDDRVCPYRMAEQAKARLAENGAKVHLETYRGGHGWRSGNIYQDIRRGVEWLEKMSGHNHLTP